MDPYPSNIDRIAAPFSLAAARSRHLLADALPDTAAGETPIPVRPTSTSRARRPHLELVAGSSIPDPTPAQITDARERFLSQTVRQIAPSPAPLPVGTAQPSTTLLKRTPWRLSQRDVARPEG